MANELTVAEKVEKFQALQKITEASMGNLAAACTKTMDPKRMARIMLTACTKNPKLLLCDPKTIIAALLQSLEMGLEPNGRQAHLIPYFNSKAKRSECQFQVDYKGMIQLAYRSGIVLSINAGAVRKGDQFHYSRGTTNILSHQPAEEGRGELRFAWAAAELKSGGTPFVVLNKSDIERIKASSDGLKTDLKYGYGTNPWIKWEESMWIKSAVKTLFKFLPSSAEMAYAVKQDDEREMGFQSMDFIDVESRDALQDAFENPTIEQGREEQKRIEADHNPVDPFKGPAEPKTEKPTSTPKTKTALKDAKASTLMVEGKISAEAGKKLLEAGVKTIGQFVDAVMNQGNEFGSNAKESEAIYFVAEGLANRIAEGE